MGIMVVRPGSGQLETPETMTFAEAQAAVEGYVERVWLDEDRTLCVLVNEEGFLRKLELNAAASMIARRRLVGVAVFLSDDDIRAVLGDEDETRCPDSSRRSRRWRPRSGVTIKRRAESRAEVDRLVVAPSRRRAKHVARASELGAGGVFVETESRGSRGAA